MFRGTCLLSLAHVMFSCDIAELRCVAAFQGMSVFAELSEQGWHEAIVHHVDADTSGARRIEVRLLTSEQVCTYMYIYIRWLVIQEWVL